jgi:two-component system OmpR family response regulator
MFGRVLVVEDDEIERTTLAEVLTVWGYQTDTASDGVEALQKVDSFHPDIVISDLQMPRMGGIELLGALQKTVPGLPCIIITACGVLEKAEAVTAVAAIDYFEKPVDLERLRADLQRCTQGHEACGWPSFLLDNPAQSLKEQAA